MPSHSDSLVTLAARIRRGNREALARAFEAYGARLTRIVEFRLDRRLSARIATEDVLQESFVQALERCGHLEGDADHAVFLWLRLIVLQTLTDLYRRHFAAGMRDVRRESGLEQRDAAGMPGLGAALLASLTSPTEGLRRAERTQQLHAALCELAEHDREVLALRHFEELSNQEVADVLRIDQKAASIRYFRALKRLKSSLESHGVQSQTLFPDAARQ